METIDILGLENFRVFGNNDRFFEQMAAINILTGVNNSGKSSVVKALQLLRNSVIGRPFPFDLDLSQQEHLLGDFQNVVYDKDNSEVNISIPFNFLGLTNLYISLTFNLDKDDSYKAKLRKIVVTDKIDNIKMFSFLYKDATEEEKEIFTKNEQNRILEGEKKYGSVYRSMSFKDKLVASVDWTIDCRKLKKYLQELRKLYLEYPKKDRTHRVLEQLDMIGVEKNIALIPSVFFSFFRNDVNTDTWQKFVEGGLNEENLSGNKKILDSHFDVPEPFYPLPEVENIFYWEVLAIIKDNLNWEDDEIEGKNVLAHFFENSIRGLMHRISSIHYISTVREQNARIYSASIHSPFINLLKEYSTLTYKETRFIEGYLRQFKIGQKLEVDYKRDQQLISVRITSSSGIERDLVDYGYGIKQIILILIQVSVLAQKNIRTIHDYDDEGEYMQDYYDPSLLLIEEPESNLHPNWQSILAEMFTEINKKFNIQLIIETHSEYMIRKFQDLVAFGNIKGSSIKIFYLRDMLNYNGKGKKMGSTTIQDDGTIDYEIFDGGFFDESDRLELSLLNMRRDKFVTEFEELKKNMYESEATNYILESQIDEFTKKSDINIYRRSILNQFNSLDVNSKTLTYLSSGQFLLHNMKDGNDFSPVIIQYGRALENELLELFSGIVPIKAPWVLGNMEIALNSAMTANSRSSNVCNSQELNKLKCKLNLFFKDTLNIKVHKISKLRKLRNSAGHAGKVQAREKAELYIISINQFLKEWFEQKL